MGFIVTILAGGEGDCMRSALPHVLNNFNGKPMLVYILEIVKKLSPDKINIIVGRHCKQTVDILQKYMCIFDINFLGYNNPGGTGHSVFGILELIKNSDRILILNGDMPLLCISIIQNLIQKTNGYDGGIVVASLDNPTGYGRIIYDNDKLKSIVEEASCTEDEKKIEIVNAGIYLFTGEILKKCVPDIKDNNSKNQFYFTDIIKILYDSNEYRITSVLLEPEENIFIRGVNTPEELAELENLYNAL